MSVQRKPTTMILFTRLQQLPTYYTVLALLAAFLGGMILNRLLMDKATSAGRKMAIEQQQRLEVIWPDPKALSDDDKLVFIEAGFECRLERVPMPTSREAVVACLREGAAAYDKRKQNEGAMAKRLERMLVEANELRR